MATPKTLYKIKPLGDTIHLYLTPYVPATVFEAVAKIEGVSGVRMFMVSHMLSVNCNPNYDIKEIAQEIDQVMITHLNSAFHEFVGNLAGLETL